MKNPERYLNDVADALNLVTKPVTHGLVVIVRRNLICVIESDQQQTTDHHLLKASPKSINTGLTARQWQACRNRIYQAISKGLLP